MARPTLALVDAHPLFLAGMRGLLSECRKFSLLACGVSSSDALEIVRSHRPEVLIIGHLDSDDISEVIREIQLIGASTKVIVCASTAEVDAVVSALEAGARGYVLKGSSADDLVTAIEAVVAGETYINQIFAAKVIAGLRQAALAKAAAQKAGLSARELQIVQHLHKGLTNREIAASLAISEKTVKHYMTVIMQKLQARNRLEVVIASRHAGAPARRSAHA